MLALLVTTCLSAKVRYLHRWLLTACEPMPSNPFTTPEPTFDAAEVLERIRTVQEENLQRLDDDLDILKAYLKTQHTPKAAIDALERLTVEQHVSWKKAIDGIKKLLTV